MMAAMKKFPDRPTTKQLAEAFGLHRDTVGQLFAPSCLGRGFTKVDRHFSAEGVAAQISYWSGHKVTTCDLPILITFRQARGILDEMGVNRCRRTWHNWHERGIGPRRVRISNRIYYLRPEVWTLALKLSELNDVSQHGAGANRGDVFSRGPAWGDSVSHKLL